MPGQPDGELRHIGEEEQTGAQWNQLPAHRAGHAISASLYNEALDRIQSGAPDSCGSS